MNSSGKILIPVFLAGILLSIPLGLNPLAQEETEWLSIRSDYLTIYYTPEVNLNRLEKLLRTRYIPVTAARRDLFTNRAYPVTDRIGSRLDLVLMRVKEVTGMNPQMDLTIKIFKNRSQVKDEYYKIYNAFENYGSFYAHRTQTIYTSEREISDSVIAHEMGHAVVDHYFGVKPPQKIAEMLAQYVDVHLGQE
jgi:hypothetical protein